MKALKGLNLKQQLLFCESYLPDAWEYLHDIAHASGLPVYDDNDDVVSWGVDTQQDTTQDKEDKNYA